MIVWPTSSRSSPDRGAEQHGAADDRGERGVSGRQPERARAHGTAVLGVGDLLAERAAGHVAPGRGGQNTRSPVIASAAGMNVTATASASSTASARPGPNVSRNPSCAATSAALAPATLRPAATTVPAISPAALSAAGAAGRAPVRGAGGSAR